MQSLVSGFLEAERRLNLKIRFVLLSYVCTNFSSKMEQMAKWQGRTIWVPSFWFWKRIALGELRLAFMCFARRVMSVEVCIGVVLTDIA